MLSPATQPILPPFGASSTIGYARFQAVFDGDNPTGETPQYKPMDQEDGMPGDPEDDDMESEDPDDEDIGDDDMDDDDADDSDEIPPQSPDEIPDPNAPKSDPLTPEPMRL